MARPPGPCGGRCPHAVARHVTDVPDSAGFRRGMRDATSEAALNRGDAHLVKINQVGSLKALGCYRELVDLEISRASEHGARWWSRRLVELYEEAGLVRLGQIAYPANPRIGLTAEEYKEFACSRIENAESKRR
jgi:hypothetical protein